jgi:hypothetical protein
MLRRSAISFRQALADQPLLNEVGYLVTIPVHHDHVGIAPDTGVRQIDDIDAAAGGRERRRVVDTALADLGPARMVLGVVAVDTRIGVFLIEATLLRSPPSVGSTATSALTLSGRASSTL